MKRVLLIDDDFAVLAISKLVLEREGYVVTTATNGEDGLAAATDTPPDIVVTDFMMPVMSGVELARQMRTQPALAQIPIILVSATYSRELGPLDERTLFLPKPVTRAALLAAIRGFLGDDKE